ESQYAFYAADAALECALYADQQQNSFAFPASDPGSSFIPPMTCDGSAPSSGGNVYYAGTKWVISEYHLPLDAGTRCADVTIYKYSVPTNGITTYIFSQGYDVGCSAVGGSRFVSRGISAHY
ncbi:MAG TPA: hypothetical protein PLW99_03665, partial [Candidatus Paceibacterota bacterium]|nr:hypothetical protein [Candidatus Paceibacterota bacterium]